MTDSGRERTWALIERLSIDPTTRVPLERVLRQRAALVDLGAEALRQSGFQPFIEHAVQAAAEGVGTTMAKIVQRQGDGTLLLIATWNLNPGYVGTVISKDDPTTPPGQSIAENRAIVVADVRKVDQYQLPQIFAEHHVISSANVPIVSQQGVFGVLEVDDIVERDFDELDLSFLTGIASLIAEGVERLKATEALTSDRDAKVTMLREQQHRIRNSFMVLHVLLDRSAREAADVESRRRLESIDRRVFALASLYDHLLGIELGARVGLVAYLCALCDSIRTFHDLDSLGIELRCGPMHEVPADLETATALGTVVNELVANSIEHAFAGVPGTIEVTLQRNADKVVVTVKDSGRGVAAGARHGTGLRIAHRFVARLGGTLDLEPGSRTVWKIVIPAPP
jgi:two-component sensor histidine kinase